MKHNEYGVQNFGQCFFFITGFHGFHVFSGVIILIVILINVIKGTYERRGHYEMVEKVGLYWHFVDLVWVFVFTFFLLSLIYKKIIIMADTTTNSNWWIWKVFWILLIANNM